MLRGPKHKNATILGKTIASFPLQGTYIQLGNYPPKSQAGKRRAEHYWDGGQLACIIAFDPRPLFGGRAWNESRTFVPKCLRGWPLSSSGMTRTVWQGLSCKEDSRWRFARRNS
ncbi:MAG: hypothetical protein Rhob2KO_09930 [Rhodopirellula baltica]